MTWRVALIVLLGVMLLLGFSALAFSKAGDKAKNEKQVTLDQCPPAVQDTIKAWASGGVIKEIERETKNAKTIYEAEILKDGKTIKIKVAEDSTLI
ncbi:MAG: hypothetical protein K6T99_08700 [Armatimonadetes bacterium]|nr:hypothetical protein [Armatimonadota bacterium]